MDARFLELAEKIQRLHDAFCHETGAQLRLGLGEYSRERFWGEYLKAGFTQDDLLIVLRYLRKRIVAGERNPGALKFSNLIERLDRFEEDLAMARADARKPGPPTAKARVIAQRERVVGEGSSALIPMTGRPVSELINDLRKAAGM